MTFFAGKPYDLLVKTMIGYFSIPQIDGKVNHHQIFHLFGDDYIAHLKNHGLFPVDVPKRPDETAFHSGAGGVSLEHPRTSWGSLAPKIVGCSSTHGSLDYPWLSQLDLVIWYRKSWVFSMFFLQRSSLQVWDGG